MPILNRLAPLLITATNSSSNPDLSLINRWLSAPDPNISSDSFVAPREHLTYKTICIIACTKSILWTGSILGRRNAYNRFLQEFGEWSEIVSEICEKRLLEDKSLHFLDRDADQRGRLYSKNRVQRISKNLKKLYTKFAFLLKN